MASKKAYLQSNMSSSQLLKSIYLPSLLFSIINPHFLNNDFINKSSLTNNDISNFYFFKLIIFLFLLTAFQYYMNNLDL